MAVHVDGEVLSDHRIVQREHAALLLPMLSELLSQMGITAKQIEGVVFGQGPGSFTGLRIAAAAAQGLALAADCGVHGVSTLQAMAKGCVRENMGTETTDYVMCALDARMDQIYANTFCYEGAVTALSNEVVINPDEFPWPAQWAEERDHQQDSTGVVLCGSGAVRYETELLASLQKTVQINLPKHHALKVQKVVNLYPNAIDLLSLTDGANLSCWKPAADAQPVYLRNKVALTEAERSST